MSRRTPARRPSRAAAPAPAVAGHRPLLLAVALAAGFAPLAVRAQAAGAQAIVGSASLSQQGNKLTVTTTNGAGGFSALNWQSFSVPGGTTTYFAQPNANSLSINRVLGGNPSAIYGTLGSNGRLVLVNPAGITVGAGAVVDTAGFTASTLRMSDADALAGRLRFDGSAGGLLRVDGSILARSGDVVLIGQDVQTGAAALVRSPQGATVLAAGRKVEVTGRGLEGIVFEVQAPTDQAVNLGTLQGDAVGVFAGTLKHSGLIQAQAVSTEGGRVVLKAADTATTDGTTQAQALAGQGGSVDVLGSKVGVLAGASIDTSNTSSGGQIRIGGDFQGHNAAVPNAQVTYVDQASTLRANATQSGNGGKVIVWADDTTRAHGTIEAKAGPDGGNGGFVETSGKRYLDANAAQVDASAAKGQGGNWLLDPGEITIVNAGTDSAASSPPDFSTGNASSATLTVGTLNNAIENNTSVTVATTSSASLSSGSGNIIFDAQGGSMAIGRTTSGTATVNFQAENDIKFRNGETRFTADAGVALTVNLNPTGKVEVESSGSLGVSAGPSGGALAVNVATGKALLLNGAADINAFSGTATLSADTITNNASLSINGPGAAVTAGVLDTSNSLAVSGGSLTVDSFTLSAGGATFDGGGSLTVSSNFSAPAMAGTFDFVDGGTLSITQGSGDLTIPGGPNPVSARGGITLHGNGGRVVVNNDLNTAGGNVLITASQDVAFQDIATAVSTSTSFSVAGGSVMITAGTGVAGGTINTSGTAGSSPAPAGSVFVTAGNGSILLDNVLAAGAYAGDGGNVSLASTGGGVTVSGSLTADAGSDGYSARANAGSVDVAADGGGIQLGSVSAQGAHGGSGRNVTISAKGGDIGIGSINSSGSDDECGECAGGDAGHVQVTARAIASAGGGISVGSITAQGGGGNYTNGSGGNVTLLADGAIDAPDVTTTSGWVSYSSPSGSAGSVRMQAGSDIRMQDINTGNSWDSYGAPSVELASTAGSITQGTFGGITTANLAAHGGGNATLTGSYNRVETVAGSVAGSFTLRNRGSFDVGSVGLADSSTIDGIQAASVSLASGSGMRVLQPITTTGGAIDLLVNDSTLSTSTALATQMAAGSGSPLEVHAALTSNGGAISLASEAAGGDGAVIQVDNAVNAGTGTVDISAPGSIDLTNATLTGSTVHVDGGDSVNVSSSTLTGSTGVSVNAAVSLNVDSSTFSAPTINLAAGDVDEQAVPSWAGLTVSNSSFTGDMVNLTGSTPGPFNWGVTLSGGNTFDATSGTNVRGYQGASSSSTAGSGGGLLVVPGDCSPCINATGDLFLQGSSSNATGIGVLLDSASIGVVGSLTINGFTAGTQGVQARFANLTGSSGLQIYSPADVAVDSSTLGSGAGALDVQSGNGTLDVSFSTLGSTGGGISLSAGGALSVVSSSVTSSTGAISLDGGTAGATGNPAVSITDSTLTTAGNLDINADGGLTIFTSETGSTLAGADVRLYASTTTSGEVVASIGGASITGGNSVSITADGGGLSISGGTSVTSNGSGPVVLQSRNPLTTGDSSVSLSDASVASKGGIIVQADEVSLSNASLAATGGDIAIAGGVQGAVISGSQITTGDTSTIQVTGGAPSSATPGVQIMSSSLSTAGGAVTLAGDSSADLAVDLSGVNVYSNGGAIDVLTPRALQMSGTWMESAGGAISVSAGAGQAAPRAALNSAAVQLLNTHLDAGAGSLAIDAIGGAGGGFIFRTAVPATLIGADIVVNGTSTGGAAISIDHETVTATNSVTMTATGGGIDVINGSTITNSGTGAVVLQSQAAGSDSYVNIGAGNTVSVGGDLVLTGNAINVSSPVTAARVVMQAQDSALPITLGDGALSGGTLNFSTTMLAGLANNKLVIGNAAQAGGIDVISDVDLSAAPSLSLLSGSDIGQQLGTTLAAQQLNVQGRNVLLGSVNLATPLGAGGVLSGGATGGDFKVANIGTAPLQIGTVDGTSGITGLADSGIPNSGRVVVSTGGAIQLSAPVSSDAQAGSNAITLAGTALATDGTGGLQATNDRWAVFVQGPPSSAMDGSPITPETAIWNRTYTGDTATSLAPTETGSRYVFAYQPQATVALQSATKVYDATDAFTGLTATVSGTPYTPLTAGSNIFAPDVITPVIAPGFGFKDVGTYSVYISATQPSSWAATNILPGTLSITPAALTIRAVSDTKVYDGTTVSLSAPSLVGLQGADTVDLLTQSFASKNVQGANGSALNVDAGFAVNDGNFGGNYTVTVVNGAAGTITPAPLALTGGLAASNKVYDATTAATLTGTGAFTGVFSGDSVTVGAATGVFSDKNVGNGKSVTLTGLTLTGADAANYTLGATPAGLITGNITPATLAITGGLSAATRNYEGSTVATILGTGTFSGLFAGDSVLVASATGAFADRNAGTGKAVTISSATLGGVDAGNYVVGALPTGVTGTIIPATFTIFASADSKTYDGSTASSRLPTFSGTIWSGDSITIQPQAFDSKNAGTRTLSTTYALSDGNGGANYNVAVIPATGTITPATLTVGGLAAQDKVYDSTTFASFAGTPTLAGTIAGDSVSVVGSGIGSFADKNVGAGKAVTLNAASLALTGTDAGNYVLAAPGTFSASISPARLVVSGLSAANKVYDGSPTAALTGTAGVVGAFPGDSVSLTATPTGTFADANAGTGKAVTVAGSALLTGADAANYVVVPPVGLTASITPAPLTVAALDQNKLQGSSFSFGGSEISVSGLVGGQQVTSAALASTGSTADAALGTYPITAGGPLAGGNGFLASNYSVTYKPGTLVVSPFQTAVNQQVDNQVVTFLKLFVQEAQTQQKDDKDKPKGQPDIVQTDAACKPS